MWGLGVLDFYVEREVVKLWGCGGQNWIRETLDC